MSSASIAAEIGQCDSNISISQEKISKLEKEISDLSLVDIKYSSMLVKLEDDYENRKRRLDAIERGYQKAKGGRTYHEGMNGDIPTYKTKITDLSNFIEKLKRDIESKRSQLEQERNNLIRLNSQRSSLETSYNQAVWNEEQERIRQQQEWEAAQQAAANANRGN